MDGCLFNVLTRTMRVVDSIFEQNSCKSGAALFIHSGALSIFKSSFLSNKATHHGGAIYLKEGTVKAVDCTFEQN